MILQRHKLTQTEIVVLGLMGVLTIFLSNLSLRPRPTRSADLKKAAAEKTALAFSAIKEYRLGKGIAIISLDDPQESGLIGVDRSPITTIAGDRESKLTSVNSNWSAWVVENLLRAEVGKGDVVAVGMTGSFPALNAAVVIALETLGAEPLWIASQGSSNWGANIPGLTWLEMERTLRENGLIEGKALGATLGGADNAGGGLTQEGREILRDSIRITQVPLIDTLPLTASIDRQMEVFRRAAASRPIRLYINIGGGLGSLGTARVKEILNPGLNSPQAFLEVRDEPVPGLVARFLAQGVPVLNLSNIIPLARDAGLPIAPSATPEPGIGPLFSSLVYPVWVNAALLLAYSALVLSVAFGLTRFILKNPRQEHVM